MDHHERVVQLLLRPSSYPHSVGRIERRQTHISQVFLAGAYAYKLKKPVKFPFLDASTVSRRKRFCQLELTLNRRLAPAMYLAIVPIVETSGTLALGPRPGGRVVDWVVKMRRLPEARMLDQLVVRRQVSRRDMARIADRTTQFFRRAARSRAIDRYGAPAQVAALVLGNLEECGPFVEPHGQSPWHRPLRPDGGDIPPTHRSLHRRAAHGRRPWRNGGVDRLLPDADRALLESAYRQYLALAEPLLARRVRERRIIDGHGDLRCENICLADGIAIFDCVEFQPAFRCGDTANDFAFLVMDLEFRGRGDLAEVLVRRYRQAMRDASVDRVLSFYKCHRSLVRGKVRGLAWLQHPTSVEGRRLRRLSRRHFQLAVRYARAFAPPRLIIIGGLIGTGKSTLARSLARAFGATWLRTDEIRLREFASTRRRRQGFGGGLYAPHVSELVYQRLIRRAEQLIRQGRSVVCDGMFAKAVGREQLRTIAQAHGASFHFFECVVPRVVALRRIARRYAKGRDLSEAKPEHYDRLARGFESANGWPSSVWTRLSDHRKPEATCQAALRVLRRAWP